MSLLSYKPKKSIARSDLPVEVPVRATTMSPAQVRRAEIARAAAAAQVAAEDYAAQLEAQRDELRARAEASEMMYERLLQREAALMHALDEEKQQSLRSQKEHITAIATVETCLTAMAQLMLKASKAIGDLQSHVDMQALADEIRETEPLPSCVTGDSSD